MKHILLATTALVATAGVAAAEVTVTSNAEIGIVGGTDMDPQWHTDWDVTFTGSGESDSGLTFGASIDLDEGGSGAAAVADDSDDGGATAFVSFGGATLTMGDTDGAFDKAMSEVALAGGSIADNETAHSGYNGNSGLDGTYDGQIARFDYAFEGFTASLSAEMDDAEVGDPVWGLGVAYNAELAGLSLGVGLGYQTINEVGSITGISLKTTFDNGLMAAINYSMADLDGVDADPTHWAVGLGYSANGLSIGVNYGEYSDWVLFATPDQSGFGLAAAYDLGGGLQAQFGYGSSDSGIDGDDSTNNYSLGLRMDF